MHYKTFFSTLIAILLIFCFTGCDNNKYPSDEDVYCTDDYPQMYEETLTAMFGDDYVNLYGKGKNESRVLEESYATQYYISWMIEYTDCHGEKQQFYFNNSLPFSHWINQHAGKIAKDYYTPLYNKYFNNLPLAQSSNMYFRILEINCNQDEVPKICEATEEYFENITTPDNCIPFSKLNEQNIFEYIPMEFSLHIFLSGEYRNAAENAANQFVTDFNKLTNNRGCLSLIVGENDGDSLDTRKYYIKGKEVYSDGYTFERDVFYALKDEFYS